MVNLSFVVYFRLSGQVSFSLLKVLCYHLPKKKINVFLSFLKFADKNEVLFFGPKLVNFYITVISGDSFPRFVTVQNDSHLLFTSISIVSDLLSFQKSSSMTRPGPLLLFSNPQ